MSVLQTVTLALDWVPNTNHVGFYVAKYKGFYRDVGLDVRFVSAHEDGFQTLPAERIYRKEVHFGIANSETVINYNVRCGSYKKSIMKAIAAVYQEDSSAIVTLKDSGIERPRQLDGMRYATYGAKYEGSLVRQLIRSDGGHGRFEELNLPLLGLWNTVMKGLADATWVFMGWEGVEARRRGIELNAFRLADYGVPYGWPELLITHADALWEHPGMVKAFLEATTKGHQYAAAHPEEAADMLVDLAREECPDMPDPLVRDMVKESMLMVAEHLLDSQGRWGVMDCQRWETFLDFLARNELLSTNIPPRREQAMPSYGQLDRLIQEDNPGGNVLREDVRASSLFTNAFLPPQLEYMERYKAQRAQQQQAADPGSSGGSGSGSGPGGGRGRSGSSDRSRDGTPADERSPRGEEQQHVEKAWAQERGRREGRGGEEQRGRNGGIEWERLSPYQQLAQEQQQNGRLQHCGRRQQPAPVLQQPSCAAGKAEGGEGGEGDIDGLFDSLRSEGSVLPSLGSGVLGSGVLSSGVLSSGGLSSDALGSGHVPECLTPCLESWQGQWPSADGCPGEVYLPHLTAHPAGAPVPAADPGCPQPLPGRSCQSSRGRLALGAGAAQRDRQQAAAS